MNRLCIFNRSNNKKIISIKYKLIRRFLKKQIFKIKNHNNNKYIIYYFYRWNIPRYSSITYNKLNCYITSRFRGCFKNFLLSRILIRSFAAKLLLPGFYL